MIRIAFLIESLSVVWGLPWCVSWVLLWTGCRECELTASQRAAYHAMEIRIQDMLVRQQSAQHLTEQQSATQN